MHPHQPVPAFSTPRQRCDVCATYAADEAGRCPLCAPAGAAGFLGAASVVDDLRAQRDRAGAEAPAEPWRR